MKITMRVGFLLCVAVVFLAAGAHAANITVFAAASLTDSLKEIARDYEAASHDHIDFNFAGSSTLARQIEAGAPADIFLSADEKWMDYVDKKGLIDEKTRKDRLSNSLVIIVGVGSSLSIASPRDLAGVERISLADPKAIPAGIYAREYLQKLNLWTAVEPKVIPGVDVRAALAAVASGNADAGVVYKTDAAISKQVKVAYEVPAADGPAITYPMAVVKSSQNAEVAGKFLGYLESPAAGQVFARFGFIVKNASP